jgi:hypothetical protein
MLLIGQTYNQRKTELLDDVRVTRGLLRQANKNLATIPALDRELRDLIQALHGDIKDRMGDLVALEKYRMREGLGHDEQLKSETQLRRERDWTPDLWNEYHERMMELDKQLVELEDEWRLQQERVAYGEERLAD